MQIPNDNMGISASLIHPKPFKFCAEALSEGSALEELGKGDRCLCGRSLQNPPEFVRFNTRD